MYDFLTGREFVVANAELHGLGDHGRRSKALATVEMEYAQDRKISTYSKGMRQRVKMASALVHEPVACCCSTSRSTAWTRASACS